MKNSYAKAFADGFIGSFIIAAVIIMAIPRAIYEFVNHRSVSEQRHETL
jgi:hypothetical protein